MMASTTCVMTADRHWVMLADLVDIILPPPLMTFRNHKFEATKKPYRVRECKRRNEVWEIQTIYNINLNINFHNRVVTQRGFVKVNAITHDDDIYLYAEGELRPTRPSKIKSNGRADCFDILIEKGNVLITRDINTRWKAAYAFGLLVCDLKGSKSTSMPHRVIKGVNAC